MASRQLSLYESVEGAPHYLSFVRTVTDGYVATCACGWQSDMKPVRALAVLDHARHLTDTPAARRAREIVTVWGRWPHE